ncbi:trans-sialidase, putative, partial [Trypanosoma cruzi marinkellei]
TNVFTGIALELLKLTDKQSKELAATEMKTQVLVECPSHKRNCASNNADQAASASEEKVHVSRPTTVVQGSEIYILLGNYSFPVTDPEADVFQWGFLLAMGTVRNNEDSTKMIHWNDTYVLPWISFEEQYESLTGLIGSGGSGVKMKDGTLVLPVEATRKVGKETKRDGAGEGGKTVSLILYSSKDTEDAKLSKGTSADGCGDPSVVEWKD